MSYGRHARGQGTAAWLRGLRLPLAILAVLPVTTVVSAALPGSIGIASAQAVAAGAVVGTVGGNGKVPVTSWPANDSPFDPSLYYPSGSSLQRMNPTGKAWTSGTVAGKDYIWFIQGNVIRQDDLATNVVTTIAGTNYTPNSYYWYGSNAMYVASGDGGQASAAQLSTSMAGPSKLAEGIYKGDGEFQRSLHGGSSVEDSRALVVELAAPLSVDD
jgi:hypothetical protein